MAGDSYSQGRLTGISDGTAAGHQGVEEYKSSQRYLERNKQMLQNQQAAMTGAARMGEEGRKLGDRLMAIIAALFLHRTSVSSASGWSASGCCSPWRLSWASRTTA